MLPVYICDDEERVRDSLQREVERQIMIGDHDMKVALCTGDPYDLLAALHENPRRGIYFLDVDLKQEELDGFRLGQEIRRLDPRGFLAYVTSYDDLAYETFRYHLEAMDYIVKGEPLKVAGAIRDCLQTVVRRMQEEQREASSNRSRVFTVHMADGVRYVPYDEIICFETGPGTHRILLRSLCECIDFSGKLSDIEREVGDFFFRCHRSFLVNRDKIRQINRKTGELVMEGGTVCLLSRAARGKL
ncbi:MAG: response regulator transcription factor [Lachnospiraceae bacterium]|jgi:two-component system response regulator AgrA|nr:response regulator transcription factor [Lachnospiraceae bacterium]